jgi:23S rRNA (cytidine1920-2'-O)/16S rRNA (cytidine1409-2'-O)-methyltransferase
MKTRLDKFLIDTGLADTRQKAQYLIMSGNVLVNDVKIEKCGHLVKPDAQVRILKAWPNYVSRGGEKLAGAFDAFNFEITNKIALDVGISTGGFTDFLLQHQVQHVFGIDVGYGQVDLKISKNAKVSVIERQNAKLLSKELIKEKLKKQPELFDLADDISLVVMDLSFISVTKVLPVIAQTVNTNADFIVLIKPQFEAEKGTVKNGGIIKDSQTIELILKAVETKLSSQFKLWGKCKSPIKGAKGNQEYFFHLRLLAR